MTKRIFAFALLSALSIKGAQASVPTAAVTFETNIKLTNATSTMTTKVLKAQEYIRKVISSEEFKNRVLNHTYNGVKTFVDNGGFTNEQIYQKMLDGAEKLNKLPNNTMDMELEMYYENSSTVGHTSSGSPKIYANTKYYDTYSAATITGNMTHEWLHKLGFTHASSYSTSRDYSVPYAVGTIVRQLANTSSLSYLTAVRGLTLNNSTTTAALSWSPALSSKGVAEYQVYRRLEGSTTNYLQGTTTGLAFSQARPTSNATYYVKTVDLGGTTAKSREVGSFVLAPVTGLTLTKTTTSVKLSWIASKSSAGVKEYKVYRKLSSSSTSYLQGTTTSLTFSQARPSTSATYYVKTVDVTGATINSSPVGYLD